MNDDKDATTYSSAPPPPPVTLDSLAETMRQLAALPPPLPKIYGGFPIDGILAKMGVRKAPAGAWPPLPGSIDILADRRLPANTLRFEWPDGSNEMWVLAYGKVWKIDGAALGFALPKRPNVP